MTMRPNLLALFAASSLVVACDARDTDNEARLFLERYDAVTRTDDAGRAARVDRLRELPLLDESVRTVRDRCVTVFLAVIRADGLLDDARARVEALEARVAGADGGAPARPTAAERTEIEALLARAAAAKETATEGNAACMDGVSRLRAHHGRRR